MEAPKRRRRSTAMMVTGIVSTALGAIAVGVGGVVWGDAQPQTICATDVVSHGELDLREEAECSGREGQSTAGIGMMIGGGAAIALGVPLLVVGARSVPVETKVGLGAASMRFRF